MKYRIIIAIASLLSANTFAQQHTGKIWGSLTNESGEALAFAEIVLMTSQGGIAGGVVSSEAGAYELAGIAPGSYTLAFKALGYQKATQQVEVSGHESLRVDMTLQEDLLHLEEVVVSGTRGAVAAQEATVTVGRVSGQTFNATQSLTLSEGLNFATGLRVESNCQNCGFTQVRMNGLDGAYTQILINSRPIFSALVGVYGLEMIPANMVERVEVVRGGGSALFGGNAIGGTVNIITRNPLYNSFNVRLHQGLVDGQASDRQFSFNASLVNDDRSMGLSAYGLKRSREAWDANGDGYSELTQIRNQTFGLEAFWQAGKQSQLKLGGFAIEESRRGGNDFELEPHQADIAEALQHRILGSNITWDWRSADYRHQVQVYASLQNTLRHSYYGAGGRVLQPGDSLTEADLLALNAYGQSEDWATNSGLKYTAQLMPSLLLTLGSEWLWNRVTDQMPGYDRQIRQQVSTLGQYAQADWDISDRLTLLLGARLDLIHILGDYQLGQQTLTNHRQLAALVPRASALYRLTPRLKARASYAQGYRAPQAFDEDLHIETVGGAARFIQLREDLQTERSHSWTASLEYTLIQGNWQADLLVDGFLTQLTNPFVLSDQAELPSGVAVIEKRNGNGATVQGINTELNMAYTRNLSLQLGFTAQTARYRESEVIWSPENGNEQTVSTRQMLRTPDLYGFATWSWKHQGWEASLSGVFTGPMTVAHVVDPASERTLLRRTPAFWEQNLRLSYRIQPKAAEYHLTLYGGIQNLTNSFQQDFDRGIDRDAGYTYGPLRPRTFFFGLQLGWR